MMFMLSAYSASATPQVIFSSFNLSIGNNTWQISGEGINANDVFTCGTNYTRNNIPITLSRDFQQNDTDVAVLIHSLANNNNVSRQWEQCIREKIEITNNLTTCIASTINYQNYSIKLNELTSCQSSLGTYNTQIADSNKKLADITWQRNALAFVVIALGFVCWNYYNKSKIKTIEGPYKQLPNSQRM